MTLYIPMRSASVSPTEAASLETPGPAWAVDVAGDFAVGFVDAIRS
jgi:hypothetical protein